MILILKKEVIMRLVKARKDCKCKRGCDIRSGDSYYPQRRKKKLCFDCGYKPAKKTFLIKLLEWLK